MINNSVLNSISELNFLKSRIVFLSFSCLCIIIIGNYISPTFLSVFNIKVMLRYASILGVLAVGITPVFIIKEIDISGGSLMAFTIIIGSNITIFMLSILNRDIARGNHIISGELIIVTTTLLTGITIGYIMGLLITKFKINSLIVTLGFLHLARAGSYIISNGQALFVSRTKYFPVLGSSDLLNIPIPFIIFVILGLAGYLLIEFTVVGKRIYAIGGNEEAAKKQGVNCDLWKIIIFMWSGFFAALAGILYTGYQGTIDPGQAVGYEIMAIAILVLGGTTLKGGEGRIEGTLIAAIMYGLLTNLLDIIGVKSWHQNFILGIIIILAVLPNYISLHKKVFK